jgi:hypothetical protein
MNEYTRCIPDSNLKNALLAVSRDGLGDSRSTLDEDTIAPSSMTEQLDAGHRKCMSCLQIVHE